MSASEHGFETPAWVHDAVFYQVFPDRFAKSDREPKPANLEAWEAPPTQNGFKGGDLVGVVEHLDYLQDLGVTAIYFNPVFKSTANHRYHTYDYLEVDPILGGDEALRVLLDEAHARGMRVVLDGVFNHVGRGLFQFSHLLENGEASPYLDWFKVRSWPLHAYGGPDTQPGYDAWWGNPALPELNVDNPVVRRYLLDVAEYWTRQGIDGWRLDVPNEVDHDFWREFRTRIKALNPDAYIVGEIWEDARPWLLGDQFDAVMNYLFLRACLGFFARPGSVSDDLLAGTGLANLEILDAQGFRSRIDSLLGMYSWPATLAQLNLLDSHDTARFSTLARGDLSAYCLAVLFQMTFPGAPCVYYGDEIGMGGGRDPDCRRAFPWDRADWNEELRAHVKRCIELRHSHRVLRSGDYTAVYAEAGVYAFVRRHDADIAVVVFNVSDESRTVHLELPVPPIRPAATPTWLGAAPQVSACAVRDWRVEPRTGDVLLTTVQPAEEQNA